MKKYNKNILVKVDLDELVETTSQLFPRLDKGKLLTELLVDSVLQCNQEQELFSLVTGINYRSTTMEELRDNGDLPTKGKKKKRVKIMDMVEDIRLDQEWTYFAGKEGDKELIYQGIITAISWESSKVKIKLTKDEFKGEVITVHFGDLRELIK